MSQILVRGNSVTYQEKYRDNNRSKFIYEIWRKNGIGKRCDNNSVGYTLTTRQCKYTAHQKDDVYSYTSPGKIVVITFSFAQWAHHWNFCFKINQMQCGICRIVGCWAGLKSVIICCIEIFSLQVGIVAFAAGTKVPSGCFASTVAEGIPTNLKILKDWVQGLVARGWYFLYNNWCRDFASLP